MARNPAQFTHTSQQFTLNWHATLRANAGTKFVQVSKWHKSSESVYEKFGMKSCANGVKCAVVEWVNKII